MDKNEITRRKLLKLAGLTGISALITACKLPFSNTTGNTGSTQIQIDQLTNTQSVPISTSTNGGEAIVTQTQQNVQNQEVGEQTQEISTQTSEPQSISELSVVHGEDPEAITFAAVNAVGGMEKFVRNGQTVVIKPNICTDYYPFEYGATTNPVVVAALVKLCIGAGASSVTVLDYPFGGTSQSAYERSGIAEAVHNAGGQMEVINTNKFVQADIPDGIDLKSWNFYKPVLDADVLIDVPIAKHHGTTRLSLAAKNFLGVIENRGGIHANIHQRIADLVSKLRPQLTVIDAVRMLMSNGPTGGNLNDVKLSNIVIASPDIVSADAYAASLFGLQGSDIGYIQNCAEMGLGNINLGEVVIDEFSI